MRGDITLRNEYCVSPVVISNILIDYPDFLNVFIRSDQ